MKSVSRFEAILLRILRAFLGRAPMEQAAPLLSRAHPRPRCLSRTCVELMEDSLTKGVVHQIARQGWPRERFLREGKVKSGRLWERTLPGELGLTFSRQSMELLLWMTSEAVPEATPPRFKGGLSLGDRLLFVLASQAISDAQLEKLEPVLWQIAPFCDDGLFALANPGGHVAPEGVGRPDFSAWLKPPGSCILEAWQSRLAQVWLECELAKRQIVEPEQLRRQGERQDRTLTVFLEACEKAGRRDLARFLLTVGQSLMSQVRVAQTSRSDGVHAFRLDAFGQEYFRMLDTRELRMAVRTETYQMGMALLRQFERLAAWQQQARTVAHYDDEYAASQLWKSDWEACDGDELSQQARRMVAALNPLST